MSNILNHPVRGFLEKLEEHAKKSSMTQYYFTSVDDIIVEYHEDWVEDEIFINQGFVYLHNGVKIDRQRALELIG